MNSYCLPNICFLQALLSSACLALYCLQYVFLMLSVRTLRSIVLLPFLAILTNLILFFMYPTHAELLFTVKPFYNLSLPLSIQPHSVVLCVWWNILAMDGGTPLWSVGKCVTVYFHDFGGFSLNCCFLKCSFLYQNF